MSAVHPGVSARIARALPCSTFVLLLLVVLAACSTAPRDRSADLSPYRRLAGLDEERNPEPGSVPMTTAHAAADTGAVSEVSLDDAISCAVNRLSAEPPSVITWDLEDRLQRRPVKRGQVLLTVADVRGPWILELQVPDRYVNYVLGAQQSLRPDLDVTFMLATDPGVSYSGRLKRFATASEPNETQQLAATAWVALERDAPPDPRPGAGVTARIYCGRRAIGYVWLHDLIATVRSRLFL